MKKQSSNLLIGVLIILLLGSCGNSDSNPNLLDHYKKMYERSLKLNDRALGLNALNQIVSLDSSQTEYEDTLTLLYYEIGNYDAVIEMGNEILGKRESSSVLNLVANSLEQKGDYANAINRYQEILQSGVDKPLIYNYQIGRCFFSMQDYPSAINKMQEVINENTSRNYYLDFQKGNDIQKVPYYYAALNLAGYSNMMIKQFDKAEEIYKILENDVPDFQLAKNNYELLKEIKAKNLQ